MKWQLSFLSSHTKSSLNKHAHHICSEVTTHGPTQSRRPITTLLRAEPPDQRSGCCQGHCLCLLDFIDVLMDAVIDFSEIT